MVLATHLVAGAALGQVVGQPVLALIAGFLSHFLLDAVPHWDYRLASLQSNPSDRLDTTMTLNRDFVSDLAKIFLDLLLGLLAVLFAANLLANWHLSGALIWGSAGALLPDFLQFAYFRLGWPALKVLQRFHVWIHTDWRLNDRAILGPFWQILLVALIFVIMGL